MRKGMVMQALGFLAFYSLLWWSFTEGSLEQLWFGGVVVVLTTFLTLKISAESRVPRLLRGKVLIQFIPYFVFQSVKGGLLVAKLAVLPQRFLHSQYFEYSSNLPADAVGARMWFASALCIFPGTLSCGYKGNTLVIHALDIGLLDEKSIRDLERIVGDMFEAS